VSAPRYQLTPGGRLVHDPSVGGVGWRLLGANNRELGRSAVAYADAESALEAVDLVRHLARAGAAHIAHASTATPWVWQLHDEAGTVVATSGRGFRHERECRYNLDQFRSAAPTAPTIEPTVPPQFAWQFEPVEPLHPEQAS
jgi:uncharacterized protein YegP (UPF0339 family)